MTWKIAWLFLFPLAAHAQPETAQSVTVKVVDEQTGAPLARAQVVLNWKQYNILTDETGQATIQVGRAEAGRSITVRRPGYVKRNVALALPQTEVKLAKAGVVQGVVKDRHQEPLVGVTVAADMEYLDRGWRRKHRRVWCETNDQGEYRLGELEPGAYEIRLSDRVAGLYYVGARPPAGRARQRYRTAVEKVTIKAGDVIEMPFATDVEPAYAIRGRIENYEKANAATIELLGVDGLPADGRLAINFESGEFEVLGVAPGEYRLALKPRQTAEGSGEVSEYAVTVSDKDVTGLVVSPGRRVPLEVVAQGCGGPERVMIELYRIPSAAWRASAQRVWGPGTGPQALTVPPGRHAIAFAGVLCTVLSARAGDQDVLAEGMLTPEHGERVRLEFELGQGGSIALKIPEELKKRGLRVIAIPVRWKGLVPEPLFVEELSMATITPGEYIVAAWPAERELAYREADVLELFRRHGVRVTVTAGQVSEVELRELVP